MAMAGYPSDLSDEEGTLLAPHLPAAKAGGRPRTTDLRRVVDAIFLPVAHRLPLAVVAGRLAAVGHGLVDFRRWRQDGVWPRIHRALDAAVRQKAGRQACPSVVIIDSRSVKTTARARVRGFDGHKKMKSRKRQLLVDTPGFPVAWRVESANMSNCNAGRYLVGGLASLWPRNNGDCRCRLSEQKARQIH